MAHTLDHETIGPAHPLVRLVFQQGGQTLTRDWYHVPRVGDGVVLMPGDQSEAGLAGTVTKVIWSDGNVMLILSE